MMPGCAVSWCGTRFVMLSRAPILLHWILFETRILVTTSSVVQSSFTSSSHANAPSTDDSSSNNSGRRSIIPLSAPSLQSRCVPQVLSHYTCPLMIDSQGQRTSLCTCSRTEKRFVYVCIFVSTTDNITPRINLAGGCWPR